MILRALHAVQTRVRRPIRHGRSGEIVVRARRFTEGEIVATREIGLDCGARRKHDSFWGELSDAFGIVTRQKFLHDADLARKC